MQIKNERIVGEPITIMAHSHGGNVAKIAINILTQQFNVNLSDINLITLNMPSRSDYEINDDAQFGVFHVNISSRIDLVQFSGGTDNVFEGGENRFSFGGNIDEKVDYNISYNDQIELLDESGCGLSGHCGLAEDNVKVWIPELKNVVNEVDKQRKSIKELQNSNSKMLHINE